MERRAKNLVKVARTGPDIPVGLQAVFDHLTGRWRDLFNISYDVLLYEADPSFTEGDSAA